MGKPKLLFAIQGQTSVLGHLLQQWNSLGARQVGVVCAADANSLFEEMDRLGVAQENRILNAESYRGMFSSIQCAANWPGWNPEITHWLITLGDQPHLRSKTLRALLDFGAVHTNKICQPMRNGRRKHPVLLPRRFFARLKNTLVGDLKMFLIEHAPELSGFDSDDASLDFDMDTPEEYERVRQLVFWRDKFREPVTSPFHNHTSGKPEIFRTPCAVEGQATDSHTAFCGTAQRRRRKPVPSCAAICLSISPSANAWTR